MNLLSIATFILITLSKEDSDRLQKILVPYGTKAGVSVVSEKGQELFSYHAEKSFSPASTAKIFSVAAALEDLKPSHQFESFFSLRGKIENQKLVGDLVITGSADPTYVIENLKEDLEKLKVLFGVRQIEGRVVFDTSYFVQSELEYFNGFEGDDGRSFTAAVTPFSLNQNSFSIWAVPGNPKPTVALMPDEAITLTVQNKLKSGSGAPSVHFNPAARSITVDGKIAVGDEPKAWYRGHPEPHKNIENLFNRIWRELGGSGKYKFAYENVKPGQLLWKSRSRPLGQIVQDINKFSLNLAAEMVVMQAATKKLGLPGSLSKVESYLAKRLIEAGFDPKTNILENASGLSRKSKLQPKALAIWLSNMRNSFAAPEWLSSLSILGIDGTVKNRLKNYAGRGRFKSGSLKDVRTLAGFIHAPSNEWLSVVIFFNQAPFSVERMQSDQDKILEILLK